MNNIENLTKNLKELFPERQIELQKYGEEDWCPRFGIMVNGKPTTICFSLEIFDDISYERNVREKGDGDVLNIQNLAIPISIKDNDQTLNDITQTLDTLIKEWLYFENETS